MPKILSRTRWRQGVTLETARKAMRDPVYFGNMMVHRGDADGLIAGLTMSYPETIRPALADPQNPRRHQDAQRACTCSSSKTGCSSSPTPRSTRIPPPRSWQRSHGFPSQAAEHYFGVEPRVAMLSYSNFGSNIDQRSTEGSRCRRDRRAAVARILVIEGEMQADTAIEPSIAAEAFPLSRIQGDANILVCPDLESANIAYKLLWRLGKVEAIGPILIGIDAAVHVLQRGVDVNDIVNMAALCVLKAQRWR